MSDPSKRLFGDGNGHGKAIYSLLYKPGHHPQQFCPRSCCLRSTRVGENPFPKDSAHLATKSPLIPRIGPFSTSAVPTRLDSTTSRVVSRHPRPRQPTYPLE